MSQNPAGNRPPDIEVPWQRFQDGACLQPHTIRLAAKMGCSVAEAVEKPTPLLRQLSQSETYAAACIDGAA